MLIFDYQFIRAMEKSEAKPNALETPQNADQANALKQKELEKGRDNIPKNSFLHEQYLQLKETFESRFFPFSDQLNSTITSTVFELHNEEQIQEECRKVEDINPNQKNLLSLFQKNPLSIMLWTLNQKGLLTDQFIQFIERVFVTKFFKTNQQSLQIDLDDQKQMTLSKLTDIDFLRQIKAFLQTQIAIKKQALLEDSFKQQFISYQKVKDMPSQYENQEIIKAQKIFIDQFNQKSSTITYYAHAKFFLFLNKSMEKLNVKKQIIKFCHKNQTWPIGHNVIDFFRRLMAIKTFFPQLFPQIINQFKIIIGEFLLRKRLKQDQMYARQILTRKYLKCVKVYSQSDNILEAAKCIYYLPKKKAIQQKINNLLHDQIVMKLKAASASKRTEQKDNESANLMRQLLKSSKAHLFGVETMEGLTFEKCTNIQFEKFKNDHDRWNPISKPTIFQLQILEINNRQILLENTSVTQIQQI